MMGKMVENDSNESDIPINTVAEFSFVDRNADSFEMCEIVTSFPLEHCRLGRLSRSDIDCGGDDFMLNAAITVKLFAIACLHNDCPYVPSPIQMTLPFETHRCLDTSSVPKTTFDSNSDNRMKGVILFFFT